jgi:NADH-quinone oxidoreductase subunit L
VGSFLTAVYTFRMIFRAFLGEPVPEARELEHGHLAHAETPVNPLTGEEEDTDVGFPGPAHHIGERELSMRVAMGLLAVGASVGGLLQIPKVTSVVDDFLEPAFADSRFYSKLDPSGGFAYVGLVAGAIIAIVGVSLAYRIWVEDPAIARRVRERFPGAHRLLVSKWYWDELIDVAFVRPAAAVGRFGQQTFERVVVNGLLVGGTTNLVRAGSAAVRAVQNGYLRYYAALLFVGLGALGVYFLASST